MHNDTATKNVTPLRPANVAGRDLRAEISELQKRAHRSGSKRMSQSVIAREIGIGPASLNRWLKGVYEGDNEGLEFKIARWIDARNARELEEQLLPAAPEWADTPTAKRVMDALRYAQMAVDIAVVYGAAGLGKTTAARRHELICPNVWIATMSPTTSSVVMCLEQIAEAVGVQENGGGARIQRSVIRRVQGTFGLVIIDEAQHLSVGALDAVRAIHDAAEIGVALMGNEMVYARMTGGNRAPYLDRLYSRIGKRVRMTRASADDVAAVTKAWGIRDASIRRALTEIAKRPGGLRAVTKVLRLASLFAGGRGVDDLSVDDIRAAWDDLGGESWD